MSYPAHVRSFIFRYGLAVVSVILSIGLQLTIAPLVGQQFPFATGYLALAVTARYGGTRPALLALFMSALGSELYLAGNYRAVGIRDPKDTAELLLFVVTGLAISLLGSEASSARNQAASSAWSSRFRDALIDQAFEPVLMWAWNGPILLWNSGAERLYGFSREEAIGRISHDLLQTETSGGVDNFIREMERLGRWGGELKHIGRDGKTIFVDSQMTLIHEAGQAYVIETNRDITERKNRELELRNVNEQLDTLVNGVTDYAISMLDPEGMILTRSRGAEIMDGYTAEETIGRHYSCLFTPVGTHQGVPERELARAAVEGKVEIEGWRSRRNGSTFWVNGTLAALYDENGQVRGFANITRDLTTKRHDDELLHSVLNNTLDCIITIDDRGTVSMINRAGETLFGRAAGEVVGQNINILMPEPYRSEHDGYLSNYMRTGNAKIIGVGREVRGRRKDGSVFPMDLAVTEFQLDSKRYFVGIVRDVSDKKMLEAQLHQSQKMEAFGQLAGGVAHDFNNLLTVIAGYAELLLGQLLPNDPKARMLTQIRSAGERAAALTQQLLAFSRQQMLEARVLDVNVIITDIETMLRRLIGEDLQLSTVLKPNLSPVKVDPGQIGQVITNLCLNARDAMPRGGEISIETHQVELDETYTKRHPEARRGQHVMIAVSDSGCGMTQEVLARIFEPFFTTKDVGRGTGLGLAVVLGIIKQSGGSIDVYSEVGVGTTFRIYLPAVQQQNAATPIDLIESPSRGSETILLVEDEDSLREFGTTVLEECGYTVLAVSNGEDALQRVADRLPEIDLLVTDVVMPKMGGRQLAEILQARRQELRVLFLSGYTDDAVVRHGILQSNVNFLQKPFSPSALSRKVRDILDQV